MPRVVLQGRKTLGPHLIDIELAVQMIDLVQEYAGIPSGSIKDLRFSPMIEATDANLPRSWNKSSEAGQAQTTFKESLRGFGNHLNRGVHNHMKRDLTSSALF